MTFFVTVFDIFAEIKRSRGMVSNEDYVFSITFESIPSVEKVAKRGCDRDFNLGKNMMKW